MLLERRGAVAAELIEGNIAHIVFQHTGIDVIHVHLRPGNDEVHQLAVPEHLHVDGLAHFAPHDVHCVLQAGGGHVQIFYLGKNIALAQSGFQRRAVQKDPSNGTQAGLIIRHDLNAYAGIVALVVRPHLGIILRGVIEGVGIVQTVKQAHGRALQHPFLVRLLIIILIDDLLDLVQFFVLLEPLVLLLGDRDHLAVAGSRALAGQRVGNGGGQQRAASQHDQHQRQKNGHLAGLGPFHTITPFPFI